MKNLLCFTLTLVFLGLCITNIKGQGRRYLDEVFSEVIVTSDTQYAENWSIFPIIAGLDSVPGIVPILMDVYEPAGDTETERPLVVLAHGGTYIPPVVNGEPIGSKTDSANVEIATRLAKRGYVVASISNRLGWFAISPEVEVKRETLLQANYRGIQDMRTAIRFFRKNATEDGNGFGIDTTKIVAGGLGTGGYITYGTTFLDDTLETQLFKFVNFNTSPPTPYIIQQVHGDPFGIKEAALNVANYPTYSSKINMGFALGGALADTSWLSGEETPFVSFHVPSDNLAPFEIDDVIESVNFDVVIQNAAGGLATLRRLNASGNNDVFLTDSLGILDNPFTEVARGKTLGLVADTADFIPGLFPIGIDFEPCEVQCVSSLVGAPVDTCAEDNSPWHWFNDAVFAGTWDVVNAGGITGEEALCQQKLVNPNIREQSVAYIDTVIGYLAPRMVLALGLDIDSVGVTSINNQLKEDVNFNVFPNPSIRDIQITANERIKSFTLFDLTGKAIRMDSSIRNSHFSLARNGLTAGMYVLKVDFEKGSVTSKIILQ